MDIQELPLTRTQKSAQTREKIIDAARTLLRKSGYEQLTVRNICQVADISNGTFYHFFKSKDDLMSVFLLWDEKPPLNGEGLEGLLDYIVNSYLKMMERYYELGLEFATHFFTPKNGAFNFQTRRGEFTTDLYVPLLKEAQELGFVDSSRPIESIIYDIQVIVIGNVFEWCVFEGDADLMGNLARMLRNYLETCVFTEAYFKRYPRSSELTLL